MGTKTLPKQCGKHSDTETHFSVTSSFKKKKFKWAENTEEMNIKIKNQIPSPPLYSHTLH